MGYCIERRDLRKTSWIFLARTKDTQLEVEPTTTIYFDEDVEYIFRVSSENKFGVGEALESEKFIFPSKSSWLN